MSVAHAMDHAVASCDRQTSSPPPHNPTYVPTVHLCPSCKKAALVYVHPDNEQYAWRCDHCGKEGCILSVASFAGYHQSMILLLPGVDDPRFDGPWETDDRYVCRTHGSIALIARVAGIGRPIWACRTCFIKTDSPALRFTARQTWKP